MSLWFRRGSREDPVVLDKRLTAIERQLSISQIVAGGTGTGLITPSGLSTLYVPFSQPGLVVTNTSTRFRVPFACTLSTIWVNLTTASSSGSVVLRITDGSTNWDNTITATNTATSSTPAASLASGALLRATVTSAGTNAADLTALVALTPT